jgi:hypothetical protein
MFNNSQELKKKKMNDDLTKEYKYKIIKINLMIILIIIYI